MRKLGLILALILIAGAAWFDWTFHSIRSEVSDIRSRLPSEQDLDRMAPEQTAETLKLADIDCQRVDKLRASAIAKLLRGEKVKQLADQCELIRARAGSLEGP